MLDLAAALFSLNAVAQDEAIYADVGYAHVTFLTDDDFGFETTSNSVISHVGWNATKYFGAEAEIGIVSFPEENSNDILSAEVKTTVTLGAYGVARYPLTEQVTVYGRAGYVYADAEFTVEAFGMETVSEDTFQWIGYGGGLRWRLGETRNGIRTEFTHYDLKDIEARAFTLAFQRHF
ncbi:outer membrane beta-barrel protein [Parvularcula marina]|uniref:outer membrane beta-barrel protein n=1 Tax=Parvularcula marina TaxID=2292771 RepID=UPI00351799D0